MKVPSPPLDDAVRPVFDSLAGALKAARPRLQAESVGTVTYIGRSIARATGLPGVASEELLDLGRGLYGVAFDLGPVEVGVMLLGDAGGLEAGNEVRRTGRLLSVPVGEEFLGRVVDPLGRPKDGGRPVRATGYLPLERPAPAIMDRLPVSMPLQTGIKTIDALIPIGRGQRELILGDRQTGKTAIAVDTIINQRSSGVICIYCAIAQQSTTVAQVIDNLRKYGVREQCIVVVAEGDDAPGLQFAAPYAAMTMGEYFMERGRDVLVVFDDLLQHAQAYREVSLLFRRPPAREAYPGDIFYIHSRLLERATRLKPEKGGGSLTALPIVETQAQNIAAYIPTNLISITDGQLYLSPDLFAKGMLPAVDVGLSVSRVGGAAQLPAYRDVAGPLRLSYTQFEELESFARFGTRLDENTRRTIEHGRRVREALKQPQFHPLGVPEQVAVLLAVTEGLFDDVPLDEVGTAEQKVREALRKQPGIAAKIANGGKLDARDRDTLRKAAREEMHGKP